MLFTTPNGIVEYITQIIVPVVELVLVIFMVTKGKGLQGLIPLYFVSCIYLLLNFLSMIIFRSGMFFSSIGSSVPRAQWLFGSKNNVSAYIVIFVCVVMTFSIQKRNRLFTWLLIEMGIFSIFFSGELGLKFMGGSSTGIIAIFICVMCYALLVFWEKMPQIFNITNTLIGIGIVNVLLLTGSSIAFINNIVTNVFNKSMTFSGRTSIWATNISHIMKSPLIGFGTEEFQATVYIDGILTTTGYRYNLLLDLALSYGIGSIIILTFTFLCIPNSKKKEMQVLDLGLIGMFVLGTMNQIEISFVLLFPIIMAAIHYSSTENTSNKISW